MVSSLILPESAKRQLANEKREAAAAAARGRQTRDLPGLTDRFVAFGLPNNNFTRDAHIDHISFSTYDEMRRSPILRAALTLIKAPILGRLKQATVKCEDPKIRRVIERVFLESGLFYRLGRTSLRALDFGVAIHELEWEAAPLDVTYTDVDPVTRQETELPAWQGMGLWPKAFHEINPQTVAWFRRRPDDGSYDGFTQRASATVPTASPTGLIDVEAVNSFVYAHDAEFGNLWGQPATKSSYPSWFWEQAILKWWMGWAERKADPSRIARHPVGDTAGTDNGVVAMRTGIKLRNDAIVALPSTMVDGSSSLYQWDITELVTTDRTDIFRHTKQELNSDQLKAMFAPERAFAVIRESGTYSESKSHVDVFLLVEDALQENFTEDVNHFPVQRVVDLNFGPDSPPCEIILPGITDEERDVRRDLLTKLIASTDPTLGGIVNVRELVEDEGVPVTDQVPPTPGVPGAPGAAGPVMPVDPLSNPSLEDAPWPAGRTTVPGPELMGLIGEQAARLARTFLRQEEDDAETVVEDGAGPEEAPGAEAQRQAPAGVGAGSEG